MSGRMELLSHSSWIVVAVGIVLVAMFVPQTPASSTQTRGQAQPAPETAPAAAAAPGDDITTDFPEKWLGTWSGMLEIRALGRPTTSIPMSLRIEPIANSDRFTWEIAYGEGNAAQVRPYELVAVDAEQGRYQIDEKNSIVLSATLMGRDLTSMFNVQGGLIVARYRFEDDAVHFRITAGAKGGKTETGGGQPGVPPVFDIPVTSIQSAVLTRTAEPESTTEIGADAD